MEDVFKNPVQLSKGVNLNDLMTETELHLDLDFKSTKHGIDVTEYGHLIPEAEDEDSDTEDVFGQVEKRTEEMMLSSPEYLSFEELAAKMVDVPCQPSGAVKITILEEGDGEIVPLNSEVKVHYAAYWEKAKVPFDSSLTANNGNPIHIQLGSGRCLRGLELALSTVRGPTARLLALLQPEVTWGVAGVLPRIRPEPALFVIALFSTSVADAHHTFNSLPTEEQNKFTTAIRTVHEIRGAASDFFKQKRYTRAITRYQQAISILSLSRPETDQERRELSNVKIKLFTNLAVCYYKMNKPGRVIDMCDNIDRIIDIDTHCKALFYKGRAYEMLGKLQEALELYKKALKLEPNNKEIGSLLAEIDGKLKKAKEDEVKMWQKAFNMELKKKETYNVDEEFEAGVRDVCEDLASRSEFTKVELPVGLVPEEVACLRSLAGQFQGLRIEEEGKGRRKRVFILKTVL